MIVIYKIGKEYYKNIDKNSGLFEYNIIKSEVESINTFKNVLIIINGILSKKDEDEINSIINNFEIKIFIMTDEIALKTNVEIINKCDYVLHQTYKMIDKIKVKQYYSFIPELFYKFVKRNVVDDCIKKDKIYFGGNDTEREDKFMLYNLYNDNELIEKRIKTKDNDFRINYFDYLHELSKCKYSLVICRKSYRNINWITSRYFESLALNVIPILDIDYDKYNFLKYDGIKSKNYEDLLYIIEHKKYCDLQKMKKIVEKNENKFFDIIISLIGE